MMGREIRRVPPNWEHPMTEFGDRYQPLHDRDYEKEASEWLNNAILWDQGMHDDQKDPDFESAKECKFYWEWAGEPPDKEHYRPKYKEEPTWYQVYETVTEGTPVSPPFATEEELIDYLVENGDFWDQRRGDPPPSREAATSFVKLGFVPSMMISHEGVKTGINIAEGLK